MFRKNGFTIIIVLLFILLFFFKPQQANADVNFTVSNMDFDPSTGVFGFDYSDTGGTTLTQLTLRLPLDASIFNYDIMFFNCTLTHCNGTYTGNKTNFTCLGSDYRVLSATNGVQYNSNALKASKFSSRCINGSTPPIPTSPPTTAVFQDYFNNLSGTLLTVHDKNWNYIDSQEPIIQNDTLFARDGYARFSIPISLINQCASFDFKYPLASKIEIWIRAKDDPTPFQQGGYYFLLDAPGSNQQFFAMEDGEGWLAKNSFPITSEGMHNFKACVVDNYLTAYLDNKQIANAYARNDLETGYARVGISQGNFIDNFSYESPFSSPTPTNAPTPTFTPAPTPIDNNVPLLKQTSNPWGPQIYNSARNWAKNNPTIYSWGCALTSASMILKYYGINMLPNGNVLDPGSLNTWLNSQTDGYIGQGFVNWLSISRLSKIATSINKIGIFEALEYKRKNTNDLNVLRNDISNQTPDIVETPGHFVVARGITENSFKINDPYYDRDTLDSYSNNFLSLGTFNPSSTDLSYLMIVGDPIISITISDLNDNQLGESFVQHPLTNDIDNSQTNNPLKMLYLAKPFSQNYKLYISSSESKLTNFKIYLYDQNGESKIINETIPTNHTPVVFSINFDKVNLSKSSATRNITINSLISDIKLLRNLKLIYFNIALLLENMANSIKKDMDRNDKKTSLAKLRTMETLIRISPLEIIHAYSKKILIDDISSVRHGIINSRGKL